MKLPTAASCGVLNPKGNKGTILLDFSYIVCIVSKRYIILKNVA